MTVSISVRPVPETQRSSAEAKTLKLPFIQHSSWVVSNFVHPLLFVEVLQAISAPCAGGNACPDQAELALTEVQEKLLTMQAGAEPKTCMCVCACRSLLRLRLPMSGGEGKKTLMFFGLPQLMHSHPHSGLSVKQAVPCLQCKARFPVTSD